MSLIHVILVRPKYSGNLGSTARAMKNMGVDKLRLVSPQAKLNSLEAIKFAAHAKDVLEGAIKYDSLSQAVEDLQLVAGFTRHVGGDRDNLMLVEDFSAWLGEQKPIHKVGLVFGPEDHGLSKEDLKYCHRLVRIPSEPEAPSLNLSQSVLIAVYELFKKQVKLSSKKNSDLAASDQQEAFYEDLQTLLGEAGFLNPQNPEHGMQLIRNLIHRALPRKEEISLLRGVLRQIRWWASQSS